MQVQLFYDDTTYWIHNKLKVLDNARKHFP